MATISLRVPQVADLKPRIAVIGGATAGAEMADRLAAQGALLLYCALIAYYAYAMRKLDDQAKKDSSADASASG